MAYTLAKINIREIKRSLAIGLQEFDLIDGLVPLTVEGLIDAGENTEPSSGEFSFFKTEKILKINNAINEDVYVNYCLLVSNKNDAIYPLDPTQQTGPFYKWVPYLQKAPSVVESAQNILEGLITYNSLSINLQTSTKRPLHKFCGSSFSVKELDFKLWRINGNDILPIYTGVGQNFDFRDVSVIYKCNAKIKKLDAPATFGFNPIDNNPESSKFHCAKIVPHSYTFSTPIEFDGYQYQPTTGYKPEGLQPCAIDYDGTSSTFSVYAGPTIGDFILDNYEDVFEFGIGPTRFQYTRIYIAQFDEYARIKYDPDPGSNLKVREFGPEYTGLSQPVRYEDTYSPLTLTTPQTVGFGPNIFQIVADNGVHQYIASENTPFLAGGALRGLYSGYGSLVSGSYQGNDNVQTVSTIGKFHLTVSIESGSKSKTKDNLNDFQFVIPPDCYNLVSENIQNTELYRYRIDFDLSKLGETFHFLKNNGNSKEDLARNRIKFLLHYEKKENQDSLSMKKFIENTLKIANLNPEISAIDFDDEMQFFQTNEKSYGEILGKLLQSYGFFLRYDHATENAEIVKIDDSENVKLTIDEKLFSNLQIRTNARDTYNKIIFQNRSAFIGSETQSKLAGNVFIQEVTAPDSLNLTDSQKEIELLTLNNPRINEVAGFNFDNKFVYSWKSPATSEILNLKLADWIYIETDQIPEPSNRAKVIITKKTINETDIGFEAIKFASID